MEGQLTIFDYINTPTEEPPKCKTCDTCEHYGWVWRYEGIPLQRACFAFRLSPETKPDKPACEAYEVRSAEREEYYRAREREANEWWNEFWGC